MHAVFMPYGKRSEVELLLRDMEAQKHLLVMRKGKQEKKQWLQGQVRILPFGVIEYIFPKEDKDAVLTTLNFKEKNFNLGKLKIGFIRKMLKCKKIPKFNEKKHYLWIKTYVTIIPIGIREDKDIVGITALDKGWTHEGI